MSSKKRSSPGTEDTKNGIADIREEDAAKLKDLASELNAAELVLERRAQEYLQPYYEKRRAILKSIPDFWSRAFSNMAGTSLQLQHQQDQEAMSYLEDVWIVRDKVEPRCFTLEFHFKKNQFFSDTVLKKEYKYVPPQASKDTKTYGTGISPDAIEFDWEKHGAPQKITIHWKSDDKNLTKAYPRVKDDDDLSEPGSFFNYFEHADDPFELGIAIVSELFPDAIDHFFGINESLDDDDDSEEEEDSEEDEIDLEIPRKKQKTG